MTRNGDDDPATGPVHFFVSYSPLDELWANWIAWQLESAGLRTMLQAWDFVPGSNFIQFMDRGVSQSVAVIVVLSRNYTKSRYGRLEWQAALRSDPDDPGRRLIPVRVDDHPLQGLLSTITFVDLVGIDDPEVARARLLQRIDEAMDGRAKPSVSPDFPGPRPAALPAPPNVPPNARPNAAPIAATGGPASGRTIPEQRRPRLAGRPVAAYPPVLAAAAPRSGITVLHLRGPQFTAAPGPPDSRPGSLLSAITSSVDWWVNAGGGPPDAVIVAGGVTRSGRIREFDEALDFLIQLRIRLGLEPHRLAVVPGGSDITRAACQAYFADCEADETEPLEPYWPKWRHFSRFFAGLYEGVDGITFDEPQPWSLFDMQDLNVVVAGLNSTMADSHLTGETAGQIGAAQARWFGQRLKSYVDRGCASIVVLADPPFEPGSAILADPVTPPRLLGDADLFQREVAPHSHVLVHGVLEDASAGRIGTIITLAPDEPSSFVVTDRPLMLGE